MNASKIKRASFAFFLLFRPTILFASVQSVYLLIPIALFFIVRSPAHFIQTSNRVFGGTFLSAMAFVLLWSLMHDLITGELFGRGFRSMFLTSLRFALYMLLAYVFVYRICKTELTLRYALISAVLAQFTFMIATLVIPGVKQFVVFQLSGLSAQSKLASKTIGSVRGFGWSEELLFTAPAACFVITMLLTRGTSPSRLFLLAGSALFGAINARTTLIFLVGYLREINFIKHYKTLGIAVIALGGSLYFQEEIAMRFQDYWKWWQYGLGEDGFRALDRLLTGHLELPLSRFQFFFGSGEYLFGENPGRGSDIGYLILLNFGGVGFLLAWTFLFLSAIYSVTPSWGDRVVLIVAFLVLALKGLVFSGNAFSAAVLILAFARGRWGSRSVTPYNRNGSTQDPSQVMDRVY